MREVHVVWHGDRWDAVDSESGDVVATAPVKEDCIRHAAEWARVQFQPISVRIHDLDGRFEEERTYPRSADPQESAG